MLSAENVQPIVADMEYLCDGYVNCTRIAQTRVSKPNPKYLVDRLKTRYAKYFMSKYAFVLGQTSVSVHIRIVLLTHESDNQKAATAMKRLFTALTN